MRLNQLDLNLFLTFEAIYTHGNLTLAARTLNVTQPAVSNALARLRDRLDDPLFIHAGKRMNPTPMAQRMIGPVRQALRLLQAGIDADAEFDPLTCDKTIRIAVGDVGETILLPRLLERLSRLAPQLKVQTLSVPRQSIARRLSLGEIDFALDIPLLASSQLKHCKLVSEAHVCAVGRRHPLADRDRITLEDYLGMTHILVSSRSRGGGIVDIELERQGLSRNVSVRLQHYQAAFHMIDAVDLAVTAPVQMTGMYDCRTFPLPLTVPNLDLFLYWHVTTDQTLISQWLREQVFSTF
ncbi:LysR family transcriptional regulator [Sneathiella sp.]|uniref:LysR family transcriptional regulator n=1 Tax=Sneathiella sp. TaxID=1964365 RepID=UPI002FE37BA6